MVRHPIIGFLVLVVSMLRPFGIERCEAALRIAENEASLTIQSRKPARELKLDRMFFETSAGRVKLPRELTAATNTNRLRRKATMDDGRVVTLSVRPAGVSDFNIRLSAEPDADIVRWAWQ